ncbi:MAG: M50 family metallopeptidase [Thermoproteus sp.]|jgi:membrane-associated protease RseP (regulator of RpoE activity)|nr:M50 family metallopeptidase [Thermoproteus sp.]MDT7882734.1 M50 family metallopeptidase [Thermoproteus sp.]
MDALETLAVYVVSWLAVALALYAIRRDLVKGFILIMWSSEGAARLIKRAAERLSFVPLRVYLAVVLALFLLSAYSPYFPIPAGTGVAYMPGFLYILLRSTYQALAGLLHGASVQEVAVVGGQAAAVPLLPGITIPWDQLPYIALAIIVGVALHEFMHGYAAARHGIGLKSAGVFSAFFVLSGAFVEPDEEQLKSSPLGARVAVFASGVAANVVLALLALAVYLAGVHAGLGGAVVAGINPATAQLGLRQGDVVVAVNGCGISADVVVPDQLLAALNAMAGNPVGAPLCSPNQTITLVVKRGGELVDVGFPAESIYVGAPLTRLIYGGPMYDAGIRPGDIVTAIYGCGGAYRIYSSGQLISVIQNIVASGLCRPGDRVVVGILRDGKAENYTVTLGHNPDNYSRPFFGIYTDGLGQLGFDTSVFAASLFANTQFVKFVMWFFLINFGLALINALPIYPLDGGLLALAVLERYLGKDVARYTVYGVTAVLAAFLVFDSALGFVSGIYNQIFSLLR